MGGGGKWTWECRFSIGMWSIWAAWCRESREVQVMTDSRFYILVAVSVFGLVYNVALFLYLGKRISRLGERMDATFDRVDAKLKS